RLRSADLRDDRALRLLGRLAGDRAQPVELARREVARDASVTDDEAEGGDADLGPLLDHLFEPVALEQCLDHRKPMDRLAAGHPTLLHDARRAIEPAARL